MELKILKKFALFNESKVTYQCTNAVYITTEIRMYACITFLLLTKVYVKSKQFYMQIIIYTVVVFTGTLLNKAAFRNRFHLMTLLNIAQRKSSVQQIIEWIVVLYKNYLYCGLIVFFVCNMLELVIKYQKQLFSIK